MQGAHLTRLLATAVAYIHLSQLAAGGAIFDVCLVSFVNPDGTTRNGEKCDSVWSSACDHIFTVCITEPDSDDSDIVGCTYAHVTSQVYDNWNTVQFDSSLGNGVDNPITLHLHSWPGSVKIHVLVEDHDGDILVEVDTFIMIYENQPNPYRQVQRRVLHGEHNKTSPNVLILEFALYCQDDYYGPTCEKYCKGRRDIDGHYTCNPVNGDIVCDEGWEGDDCDIFSDDCVENECANNSTCLDAQYYYVCQCPVGYSGQHCEIDVDECASSPCSNGATCHDKLGHFFCACSSGFLGDVCQYHACNESLLCQNNSTCIDNGACLCTAGYTGDHCETDLCDLITCHNNGNCHSGKCECPLGFSGESCEINLCDIVSCQNGGTCRLGHCTCATGYTGVHCDENINDCVGNPCQHMGTCYDAVGGYTCKCLPHFNGSQCESSHLLIPEFSILPYIVYDSAGHHRDHIIAIPDYGVALLTVLVLLILIIVVAVSMRFYHNRNSSMDEEEIRRNSDFNNPLHVPPVTMRSEISDGVTSGTVYPASSPCSEEQPFNNIRRGSVLGNGATNSEFENPVYNLNLVQETPKIGPLEAGVIASGLLFKAADTDKEGLIEAEPDD